VGYSEYAVPERIMVTAEDLASSGQVFSDAQRKNCLAHACVAVAAAGGIDRGSVFDDAIPAAELSGFPAFIDLVQAVVQRFQCDAQFLRRCRFVAVMLVQNGKDHFFFHFPQCSGGCTNDDRHFR